MVVDTDDCGCQVVKTRYGGVPSELAQNINHRQAIQENPVYNARGESIKLDVLIGEPDGEKVSIVVFLRSLG